ncbi:MAG: AI-2E family transporter, partial [Gemmatimonadetes bacterium]|nr:AI-2E family transporter [Gemmatimonadota bacterium]
MSAGSGLKGEASGRGGRASGEVGGGGAEGPGATPATWRVIQGAVVILAAGFFLFSLREMLNPFLIYCAFIALLIPFRGVRGHAHMVTVATVLVALWVLQTAGSLLGPFFLAFVLAYILDPVVDRVSAHPKLGRTASILVILVPFLALGVLVFAVGLPQFVGQAQALIGRVPEFVAKLHDWVAGLTPESLGFDLPLVDEGELLAQIQHIDANA